MFDAGTFWALNLATFNLLYGMFPHSFLRSLQIATSTQKDAAALTTHIQVRARASSLQSLAFSHPARWPLTPSLPRRCCNAMRCTRRSWT